MKPAKLLLIFLVIGGLSGCISIDKSVATSPEIELTDLKELPVPSEGYVSRIRPGDQLTINVLNSELLTGQYLVDENGYLLFPLIGEVPAANAFPNQIGQEIKSRLAEGFVLNPEVTVIPAEVARPSISIGGQVKQPGTYPARISRTLLRAINNAGGLNEYGDAKDVLVRREVDGVSYIGVYDLAAIERGNLADPALYSNDVVSVGDSPSKRNLEYILGFMPAVSTIGLLIYRFGL